MDNDDRIITDTCDTCKVRSPGVLRHSNGTPVLFICRTCDDRAFEATSRRDIDRWLSGAEGPGQR